VAVLSIDLNNVHKSEPDSALAGRILRLADALRARLTTACGYDVVRLDPAAEALGHLTNGYFYDHPDVAAELGHRAGADWIVVPRLNRATAWAADLQAHVVRVRDTTLVSNRIVEFKGLELTPELAAHLIERGAAWMADQISQVIELSQNHGNPVARRCPP
jgi:glycine cleavage system protein P-like pyridoxal-binding family